MSKQKTIWIRTEIYEKLKELSQKQGQSLTQIVNEATTDFVKKME